MSKNIMRIAFVLLALAVILGAFGAHALEGHLEAKQLKAWHTAVQYQVYHALGILLLILLSSKPFINAGRIRYSLYFLLIGIFLFSGSLYVLSTRDLTGLNVGWLGPITPLGGVCFFTGWILAAFSIRRKTETTN